MIKQGTPVVPPIESDRESLKDHSQIVQSNLKQLFQNAHTHTGTTTVPGKDDYNIWDIVPVTTGSTQSLYIKFPTGWKKVALTD